MISLLWKIVKDERGSINFASNTITSVLDRQAAEARGAAPKVEDSQWPNSKALQDYLSSTLLGGSTYKYNPAFDLKQPEVEKAAESTILGKLNNLPQAETYKAQVEASKNQALAREKESAISQKNEEQEMYNRLGLVSSTPWMARAGELGDESLMRQGDITAGYDQYGLDYALKADDLANQIATQWTGLGSVLGQNQTSNQKYGQQMSMQDSQATIDDILKYLNMGAATPEQLYQSNMFDWQQPNEYDRISSFLGSLNLV